MILITGATGLLGKHVTDRFVAAGLPLRCLVRSAAALEPGPGREVHEGDILQPESLDAALRGVDTVIHTAAQVRFRKKDRREIYEVNVQGTANVVNACLRSGVKRLVHVSSVAALGKSREAIVTEDAKWGKSGARSAYAESKYAAEQEVIRGQEEGLSTVILNPSVILGTSHPSRSSSRIFRYVWNRSRFYTDGSINYVDVRDVAEAVFRIHSLSVEGERFIVNAGSISYRDFLSSIAIRLNKPVPRIRLSSPWLKVLARMEQVRSFFTGSDPLVTAETVRLARLAPRYDNSKLSNLLNMPYRDLEDTLTWCCAWYREGWASNDWTSR